MHCPAGTGAGLGGLGPGCGLGAGLAPQQSSVQHRDIGEELLVEQPEAQLLECLEPIVQ